jgi:DNA-binding SARP family transcriptional activator
LGGLTIQVDEKPVTNLASRKAEALLIYLTIEQRPVPREFLADLLWDDRSQAQAMGNLRVILSSLHKQLPDFVTITRTTAVLNPQAQVWVDVLALEAAAVLSQP